MLSAMERGRHPQHDAVSAEVRSWYTGSAPEIGYEVADRWYGHFGSVVADGGRGGAATPVRAILRLDDPGGVARALADVLDECRGLAVPVWVDDRGRAGLLDSALREAGALADHATTYLAMTRPVEAGGARSPAPVLESVQAERLPLWCQVKLQAFADSEAPPDPAHLRRELGIRLRELAISEYRLAVVDGAAAGILGAYVGQDRMVYNLGTRLPWRGRGLAGALLAAWAADGERDGARSLLINATEGGEPARWYRRLGYSDEVYWYREYRIA